MDQAESEEAPLPVCINSYLMVGAGRESYHGRTLSLHMFLPLAREPASIGS